MTSGERRRCMWLLRRAKQGDVFAYEKVTDEIAHHFYYMIRGYSSVDPSYDYDDLKQRFKIGIWQAIPKVDDRGDPLYHLAWRGQRSVCSMLAVIKRRRNGTDKWVEDYGEERSIGVIPEGFDLPDPDPASDPSYVVQLEEERDEAHRRIVRVMAAVRLTDRQQEVVDWMLADRDPQALGANQRLATHLGVSEQAASVLRRRVTNKLTVADRPE